MSTSLVIVAIPAQDELVWKVSSEKVPHLTLMYLGEESDEHNVARMAEFVEHALKVNQHGPFYLDVDYRDELGPDKADVIFFNGGWEAKWIKSLRSQLLKQNDIRAAYESTEQFPDWVPHLTLGYPATPAKELPADHSKIYGVQFDRIAVWNGDYEGPEFRLRWPEREELDDPAIAWSLSEEGEEHILRHHGVKGMKWGVRPVLDEDGYITSVEMEESDSMAQTADLGLEFLEHYGVKGMRWGQRKTPEARTPVATSHVPHGSRRKTQIQTDGGENHPAHEDAIKVAEARVKLAKSGTAALSNKELKDVAQRLQLEQQVKQLVMPKGRKFVTNLLKNQGNQQANQFVGNQVRRRISPA